MWGRGVGLIWNIREREELKMLPDFWIVGNLGEEVWRLKMISN